MRYTTGVDAGGIGSGEVGLRSADSSRRCCCCWILRMVSVSSLACESSLSKSVGVPSVLVQDLEVVVLPNVEGLDGVCLVVLEQL